MLRLASIITFMATHAYGQTSADSADETDLSRYEIFEEGDTLVTLSDIEASQNRYVADIPQVACGLAAGSPEFAI